MTKINIDILKWTSNRKDELNNRKELLEQELKSIDSELEKLNSVTDYLATYLTPNLYKEAFDKYILHIQAYCDWQKINGENPDEVFLRSIEEQIGISENAKKAFREEILIRKSSYQRKGLEFNYISHKRLKDAIERYFNK